MIKQVIDLWRRPLKPSPTQGSSPIEDLHSELASLASKVSFGRDSFGVNGDSGVKPRVAIDYITLEVEDIINRISVLSGKIDELYRRPRMPHTQTHSAGQICKLVEDGNIEPDWDNTFPVGFESDTFTTGDESALTGTQTVNLQINTWLIQVQPYYFTTTSGATTGAFTTRTGGMPNQVGFITSFQVNAVDGVRYETFTWHYESDDWFITSSTARTEWETEPGVTTVPVTTATGTNRLESINLGPV